MNVEQAIKMSNLALGVTYLCKMNEINKFTEIIKDLEQDMDILYDELCLRFKDFDKVQDFLKECEEFAS